MRPANQRRELEAGVELITALMAALAEISDCTCGSLDDEDNDGADGRDYPAICARIERALSDLHQLSGYTREGALRALADMLTQVADAGSCAGDWAPLLTTEGAFARQRGFQ